MEKTKKKRKQLSINLGSYHDEWIKISRQYNVRPATFAAALIRNAIEAHKLQQWDASDLKALADYLSSEEKKEFKVILRRDELAALDRFAGHMGISKTQAIRALIRYFTVNEPQYTLDETDALEKSNEEMRMIGVNLNQIARKVNSMDVKRFNDYDAKTIKELVTRLVNRVDKLSGAIIDHTAKVYALINAGKHLFDLITGESYYGQQKY
ncbi:plasmid mobilization relaxosome protein MobC [Succinivibrio dextrinosolvens]|uniref:plasmid mobilization relaxosome protein MobC n=1 Tax=Succinivibrio dextrinosolvens TaxID=83771 RepID=UPI00247918B0|nr:plasmid mobilization relaxosome protein MobC [Succinivibrio dextrinosolvens]